MQLTTPSHVTIIESSIILSAARYIERPHADPFKRASLPIGPEFDRRFIFPQQVNSIVYIPAYELEEGGNVAMNHMAQTLGEAVDRHMMIETPLPAGPSPWATQYIMIVDFDTYAQGIEAAHDSNPGPDQPWDFWEGLGPSALIHRPQLSYHGYPVYMSRGAAVKHCVIDYKNSVIASLKLNVSLRYSTTAEEPTAKAQDLTNPKITPETVTLGMFLGFFGGLMYRLTEE